MAVSHGNIVEPHIRTRRFKVLSPLGTLKSPPQFEPRLKKFRTKAKTVVVSLTKPWFGTHGQVGCLDLRERDTATVVLAGWPECRACPFPTAFVEPCRIVQVVVDTSIQLERCLGRVDMTIDIGQEALDLGGTPVSTIADTAPASKVGVDALVD